MKRGPEKLLKEALEYAPEIRAALAASLLGSLDDAVDENAASAWQVEISRRMEALDAGSVRTVPWAEARRKIAGR